MKYNIRDKWLAVSVCRNEVTGRKDFNVSGTTRWKICGSKSVASKYANAWYSDSDSLSEMPLCTRALQCKELGNLIKGFQWYNGKDAIKVVDELTGVANEIVNMAANLGTGF